MRYVVPYYLLIHTRWPLRWRKGHGHNTFAIRAYFDGTQVAAIDQGPFSISLLKLSQLKAKSWSQPSNLLQTGFLSCVQVSDLSEILTWDSS